MANHPIRLTVAVYDGPPFPRSSLSFSCCCWYHGLIDTTLFICSVSQGRPRRVNRVNWSFISQSKRRLFGVIIRLYWFDTYCGFLSSNFSSSKILCALRASYLNHNLHQDTRLVTGHPQSRRTILQYRDTKISEYISSRQHILLQIQAWALPIGFALPTLVLTKWGFQCQKYFQAYCGQRKKFEYWSLDW